MIIKSMHDMGIRSEHAYLAGMASIGLSIAAWATSLSVEPGVGLDRADRWGALRRRMGAHLLRPRPCPLPLRAAGRHPQRHRP